jgi:hypothetical protein
MTIMVTYWFLQWNEYWLLILINHRRWCIVMDGVDVSVIGCVCVADIGGVSRTHYTCDYQQHNTYEKITYHSKSVVLVIGEDVSDTGNISVSDLSYFSIRS